jgi:hypothetical protein
MRSFIYVKERGLITIPRRTKEGFSMNQLRQEVRRMEKAHRSNILQ